MFTLSLGFKARLYGGSAPAPAFDPTTLFTGTDTGWVYDLSDMSTLFQDAAGTTPVTAVGQPVGLVLDKSKGLVLGPELVTNGDFSNGATGWTATNSGAMTADGGGYRITNIVAGASAMSQSFTTVVGRGYFVTLDVLGFGGGASSGQVRAGTTAAAFNNGFAALPTGSATFYFVASATTTFISVVANSGTVGAYGAYDNISVKELPGNHRTQSTALNRPTYQVDDNGNYYLSYDGINDSLATASFAWGTDKATVVAGVRKLSDAARGAVVEHTASIDANNGGFHLTAPNAASATFAFESKGTTLTDAVASSVAAPTTRVLTGIGDIAGDSAIIRLDGSVIDTDTGDQGSGNYASAVNYFGARAGTSLFFNGREYSNVGINRLLTTQELDDLEAWTAGRTGITL
jgi:hypothetical protein